LEVHADGAAGVLVADVASHEIGASESTTYDDVELAALDLSEVTAGSDALTVTWADIDASLTAAGAPSFGGFYEAGAALDPLTVVLEVEATTVPPGDAGTGVDGATVDKTTLAPGDELTVTGAGFTPGEQVEVWLHSDPSWMGTTVTDSAGVVSFTFELPLDLDPGQHHIELIGISSGLVLASPDFTVTGSGVGAGAVTPTGALPYTGADSVAVGAAGATLLGAGLGLAVVARRRLRATAT
jgi:LPXTG-motif cell wall-anchored protein